MESFGRLVTLLPDYVRGQVYRAAALGGAGRDGEAVAAYLTATEERPGTVMLEDRILPSFERWARNGAPEAAYWYGVVLREYGHFPEALVAFERASGGGNPIAVQELRDLRKLVDSAAQR